MSKNKGKRLLRKVEQSIWIKASPQSVFRALTEAKELNRWLFKGCESDPRAGGRLLLSWGGPKFEQRFLTVRPYREVSFTWHWPKSHGQGEVVMFRLRPKHQGTYVTVIHNGFDSSQKLVDMFMGYVEGWATYLCNLKSVLEKKWDMRAHQPVGSVLK